MLADNGVSAFPELGPMGGVINKIPVIASDGVLSGQVILVDASGIAAAPGEVALQDFHEGNIISDSAPDSPVAASTTVTSLWQSNLAAIMVERFFCCVKLRSDAVAFASGAFQLASVRSAPCCPRKNCFCKQLDALWRNALGNACCRCKPRSIN